VGLWGARVLVVDDDRDSLDLMERLLAAEGVSVLPVRSAGEALATVVGAVPDALVVDLALPGEDGFALMRKVRTLPPAKGGRAPAISISAYTLAGERLDRWRAAGFQSHVPKPFPPGALIAAVASLLGGAVERRGVVKVVGARREDPPEDRRASPTTEGV
jgi:CheY-like chemotaxis protein